MPSRSGGPTIADVAKAANVANSTVSRAFARPERLNQKTVDHVREVAKQLRYSPSPVARALSTGKSNIIGLIVPDIANPFFSPLIQVAQRKAEDAGFDVFLGDSNEESEREEKLVRRFSQQVAGTIIISSRLSANQVKICAGNHPVVFINQDSKGSMRVLIDSAPGLIQAIKHLADLGHKHIAYVGGPTKSWAQKRRLFSIRQEVDNEDIELTIFSALKPTHEGGRKLAQAVAKSGATALIAFDDLLALGLIAGLLEAGFRVPEDFSVIGCDDVIGATTTPPLTTISAPLQEAAEAAIELLSIILEGSSVTDVRHVLGTQLIIRQSTGAPSRDSSDKNTSS